jgi:RNA binding exosome subunit
MGNLLDNAGALSRMAARNTFGLRVTQKHGVNAYILTTKIKKILSKEFTPEQFEKYLKQNSYVASTTVNRIDKINQFSTRLDKIPVAGVETLYKAYESDGVSELVKMLSWPMARLLKAGTWTNEDND